MRRIPTTDAERRRTVIVRLGHQRRDKHHWTRDLITGRIWITVKPGRGALTRYDVARRLGLAMVAGCLLGGVVFGMIRVSLANAPQAGKSSTQVPPARIRDADHFP